MGFVSLSPTCAPGLVFPGVIYFAGLQALGSGRDIELDVLSFLQALVAIHLDG